MDPESVNELKFYTCVSERDVHVQYKYNKEKFHKKYPIWCDLDEYGRILKPFTTTGTINLDIYLKECIKKRLIYFIKNKSMLFWPNMATSHYD